MLNVNFRLKLTKKIKITFVFAVFIIALFFVWNNILILDDLNHNFSEDFYSSTTSAENQFGHPQSEISATPTPHQNNNIQKKGYHIHVNLDEKLLYVYKNGELLKTYPCSGGKSATPSPEGTWKIISKDTWGEGFGGAWLGFNVPWGKYGIHGTVYPWVIGKSNASKGCIRMLNKDARELYKLVPHGATVTIVHSNRIFRMLKSGDIGSDVKDIQKALNKLGYYKAGTDGKFGPGLKNSVQKFQKDNKIQPTGSVDRRTYNLIMQKVKAIEQPIG